MDAKSVGIREVNQNAGRLIRQVGRTGEAIVITDRGQPVAVLAPVPAARISTFERLEDEGRVLRAAGRIEDVVQSEWTAAQTPTQALSELRGEH